MKSTSLDRDINAALEAENAQYGTFTFSLPYSR